ncbi:MAG: hypothetical protein Q9M36_09935 [Sulfurovum sp.]|nr:hypothetical protein [Sulfurovum sp.]
MPNITELRAETLDNGVTNRDTAFTNFLKFPSAANRSSVSGTMLNVGSWGNVWASSVDGSFSHFLDFGSGASDWNYGFRANGLSVRCLRD